MYNIYENGCRPKAFTAQDTYNSSQNNTKPYDTEHNDSMYWYPKKIAIYLSWALIYVIT